ncbi:MAG: Lpg1974 family pore-forming outer membrane protein [Rhabdochlamydiaceae bacterium]
MKIQKFATFFVLSAAALTQSLEAGVEEAQLRNLENRLSSLEQKRCSGMINPAARPTVDDGLDVSISGSFLYWKVQEDGIAYALKNHNANQSAVAIIEGKMKNIQSDYHPGSRLGIGLNLPHDGWDLGLTWTRFFNHEHNSSYAVVGGSNLYPTLVHPSTSTPSGNLSHAEATRRLHLNMADFSLGREFFVSKYLTLRPHAGLKSAWIRKKLDANYSYTDGNSLAQVAPQFQSKFWGIGLGTGLDAFWSLGNSLSLYTQGHIGMLRGHFDLNQKQKQIAGSSVSVDTNVRNHINTTKPVSRLAAGLAWENRFNDDNAFLRLQAGWEQQSFVGQNQYMKFVTNPEYIHVANQGDLSFEGWTLSIQLDF